MADTLDGIIWDIIAIQGTAWAELAAITARLQDLPRDDDTATLEREVLKGRQAMTALVAATSSVRDGRRGRALTARRARIRAARQNGTGEVD
jgi:hypothetical protein